MAAESGRAGPRLGPLGLSAGSFWSSQPAPKECSGSVRLLPLKAQRLASLGL